MKISIFGILLILTSCFPQKWQLACHKEIQQGNWITRKQILLLRPEMTREQVRFILGSPILSFQMNRWDYPYYFKSSNGVIKKQNFTVWFDNDQLIRWSEDFHS